MANSRPDTASNSVLQDTVLVVTVFAAGAFVGIEFTARLVLAESRTPWLEPGWLATADLVRYLLFAVVAVGFALLVYLEHYADENRVTARLRG